jgi:putative NADH-flavin reductase
MKVALIGATGYVGSRIMVEALQRGHEVSAIARRPEKLPLVPNLSPLKGDVFDGEGLTALLAGHDCAINAFHPGWGSIDDGPLQVRGAQAILGACRQAGVPRLLQVGAAGTLEVQPGLDLLDSPAFPSEMVSGARGARAVLALLRDEHDVQWSVLTPSAVLEPGRRSGSFRVGDDELLMADDGVSSISLEDYAVALIDELENPQHAGQRFTVGY